MSVVLSVRIDEEDAEDIERLGINPSEFLREALKAELKRRKGRAALEWLKKNRLPRGKKSVVKMIREDRDSR